MYLGDKMKKTFLLIIIALVSGSLLGKLTFEKYEKTEKVVNYKTNLYMLKINSYNTKEEMNSSITNFDRYIYIEENNKVTAYVAISTSLKNIEKIKDIYYKKNINLSVEQVLIDNDEFIQNLNEYEKLLDLSDDEKSLLMIQNQILSCYEQMVVNDE